ncbi:MAG: hypothetical protein DSY37_04920 [Hyperthermus sp.]|nr:MAG: hypothetical protein DSY37_04920 [Hyperthermus sp.]
MPFATGFILLTPHYRSEPGRSEVIKYMERLGFEVYDVGKPAFLVFYVEADDVDSLENIIKIVEEHDGVAKAYIAYGFMGDDYLREYINEALERGEIELDESTINYIKSILAKLKPASK